MLSSSKGQTRTGFQESLIVSDSVAMKWAAALKQLETPGDPLLEGGSCALRRKFRRLVKDAGLQHHDLQLSSLRRGGATNMFHQCASLDSVADRGRRNIRTCRLYIDAALQDAAASKAESEQRLEAGSKSYDAFVQGL